jgi:hypothetical protein
MKLDNKKTKILAILLVLGFVTSIGTLYAQDTVPADGTLTINFKNGETKNIPVHANVKKGTHDTDVVPQEITFTGDSPITRGKLRLNIHAGCDMPQDFELQLNEGNILPVGCKSAQFTLLLSGKTLSLKSVQCLDKPTENPGNNTEPGNRTDDKNMTNDQNPTADNQNPGGNNQNTQQNRGNSNNPGTPGRNDQGYINLGDYRTT